MTICFAWLQSNPRQVSADPSPAPTCSKNSPSLHGALSNSQHNLQPLMLGGEPGRMDGSAERLAAWVGKGSAVAATAAAGEDGAAEQVSPPAAHAPSVGDGSENGGSEAEAGARASEPSAASIAVLGSEESEMGRYERRAPHQRSLATPRRTLWVLKSCSEAMQALRSLLCQLQATVTCEGWSACGTLKSNTYGNLSQLSDHMPHLGRNENEAYCLRWFACGDPAKDPFRLAHQAGALGAGPEAGGARVGGRRGGRRGRRRSRPRVPAPHAAPALRGGFRACTLTRHNTLSTRAGTAWNISSLNVSEQQPI